METHLIRRHFKLIWFVLMAMAFAMAVIHGRAQQDYRAGQGFSFGASVPPGSCSDGEIYALSTPPSIYQCDTNLWRRIRPASRLVQSASHSIVTGTGATGFQVSSANDANVAYSVTVAVTATIGGASSGTVVLETAATNSATPGDWTEVARFTNGQAITLAIVLQSVQTIAGELSGYVPAGSYVKLRSIDNAGSPVYTYNTGRELLF